MTIHERIVAAALERPVAGRALEPEQFSADQVQKLAEVQFQLMLAKAKLEVNRQERRLIEEWLQWFVRLSGGMGACAAGVLGAFGYLHVPEPGTLIGVGLGVLGWNRIRRALITDDAAPPQESP